MSSEVWEKWKQNDRHRGNRGQRGAGAEERAIGQQSVVRWNVGYFDKFRWHFVRSAERGTEALEHAVFGQLGCRQEDGRGRELRDYRDRLNSWRSRRSLLSLRARLLARRSFVCLQVLAVNEHILGQIEFIGAAKTCPKSLWAPRTNEASHGLFHI